MAGGIKNGRVSTLTGCRSKVKFKDGSFRDARFELPWAICMTQDQTLLVGDVNRLRILDLNKKTVSTFHIPYHSLWRDTWHIQSIIEDSEKNIYIAVENVILKLESYWKWKRLLWIGNLKEDENYCFLARLPRDIIKEIAVWWLSASESLKAEVDRRPSNLCLQSYDIHLKQKLKIDFWIGRDQFT